MDEGSAPARVEAADGEERGVSLSQIPALLIIRGVVMMLVAVGLIGGLHAYLAERIVHGFGATGVAAYAGDAIFLLLFAAIPAGFAAGRGRPTLVNRALLWTAHLWIGTFGVLLSTVLFADLARFVASLLPGVGPVPWTARWSAAVLAIAALAVVWGVYVARAPARIVRRKIPVKDLHPGMHGVKIVQISDIHIGQTLGEKFLRRIVEQVNALDADIVAVTGDLVDGFVHSTRDQVKPLSELRARLGRFYVTGNHEYYYGGPAWEAEVRRLGLTVLRNEHHTIERDGGRLVVAGVTDHNAGGFGEAHACNPEAALSGAPKEVPRVLLAHQPRSAFLVREQRVDLQLSGHTHGGQIFPFMFFVRLQQPVISGLATVNGVRVYTHNGTGYWGPPMRLGPAPEIAVLELVAE